MIVLYLLFVPVGLWLLTEAMWQHGAPFRYRVLALLGFIGVVAGVAVGNGLVSGAGGVCFVLGQLLVTRYVRSGYYHGWTVRFGRKRARRGRHGRPTPQAAAVAAEPTVEAGADEGFYAGYGDWQQGEGQGTAAFAAPAVEGDAYTAGAPGAYESGAYQTGAFVPEAAYDTGAHPVAAYDSGPFEAVGYDTGGHPVVTPGGSYDTGGHPVVTPGGLYDTGGHPVLGYDTGSFRAPEYDTGAYLAIDDPGTGFPAQPRPMSSDTSAAPIPAPMSPPPGWAAAPTAYNPDTDERLG